MDLDDKLTLAGPEGIDLDLVLAGIGSRGSALFIDALMQLGAIMVIGLAASALGDGGIAVLAVGTFLVVFAYPVLLEAFNDGRTLGKQVIGIAVVRTDGGRIGFVASAIRNVLRLIDLLPGAYLVGMVAILASSRNQRLGDMVAGTLVVRHVRHELPGSVPGGFDQLWGPLPPDPPPEVMAWDTSGVTAEEVAAIRAFLARRGQLDPAHRHQLAQQLANQVLPKVAGVPLDGGPEAFLERVAYARAFR